MSAATAGPALPVGPLEIEALRESFARVGVAVLGPPALSPSRHLRLLEEATANFLAESWLLTGSTSRGEINQATVRGHLGPTAREFLGSLEVAEILRAVTGLTLTPGWSATCYTYYRGPGQFLGEHCDKPESCRIAMLIYLDVRWGPTGRPSPGVGLTVYRGDNSSSGIAAQVTARANRITIINGANQAHERPPLDEGESVVLLAGCFAMV